MEKGNTMIEPANFIDSEDCQGNPRKYWRSFGQAIDGSFVCGTGDSAKEAEYNCEMNVIEKNTFLKQSAKDRLRAYINRKEIYSADLPDILKCIGELLGV